MATDQSTIQLAFELVGEAEMQKLQKGLQNIINQQRRLAQQSGLTSKQMGATKASMTAMTKDGRQVVGTMTRMADGTTRFNTSIRNTAGVMSKASKGMIVSWQAVRRVISGVVIARALGKVSQSFNQAFNDAQKFLRAVEEVRTLQAGAAKTTQDWTKELLKLSDAAGIDVLSLSEAAYQALSNQVANAASSTAFLSEALDLSIVSASNAQTSVAALSSIINAYNLSVSDAREVSAALFVTIEQGRLRLSDIANTIGSVAIVADQLGVSYQELLGSIAVLTKQGVTAANAQTYLRTAMLALIKPTDELTDAIVSLGYASPVAAVQQIGLINVMALLAQKAGTTNSELAEMARYFSRVRGLMGATGLTKDLGDVADVVLKVTDSLNKYNTEVQQVKDSPIFRIQREWVQMGNNMIRMNEKLIGVLDEVNKVIDFSSNMWYIVVPAIGAAIAAVTAIIFKLTGLGAALWAVGGAIVGGLSIPMLGVVGVIAAAVAAVGAFLFIVYDTIQAFHDSAAVFEVDYEKIALKAEDSAKRYEIAWRDATAQVNKSIDKQADKTLKTIDGLIGSLEARLSKIGKTLELRNKLLESYLDHEISNAKIFAAIQTELGALEVAAQRAIEANNFERYLEIVEEADKLIGRMESIEGPVWKWSDPGSGRDPEALYQIPVDFKREAKNSKYFYAQLEKGALAALATTKDLHDEQFRIEDDAIKGAKRLKKEVAALSARRAELQGSLEGALAPTSQLITQAAEEAQHLATAMGEISKESLETLGMDSYLGRATKFLKKIWEFDLADPDKSAREEQRVIDITEAYGSLSDTIEEIRTNAQNVTDVGGVEIMTGEALAQQEALLLQARTKIQELKDLGVAIPETVDRLLESIQQKVSVLVPQIEAITQIQDAIGDVEVNMADAVAPLDAMAQALRTGVGLTAELQKGLNSAFDGTSSRMQTLRQDVDALATSINALNSAAVLYANQAAANARAKVPGSFFGGMIMQRASGGTLPQRASGGSLWGLGQDQILAALAPGEGVLNRASMARFFPQFTAMNSGGPAAQVQGSVQVGDINVTVQGGDTSEQTVRDLGREIQRAVRRKVLRLV